MGTFNKAFGRRDLEIYKIIPVSVKHHTIGDTVILADIKPSLINFQTDGNLSADIDALVKASSSAVKT